MAYSANPNRALVAQLAVKTDQLEKGLAKANATIQRTWTQIEGRTGNARRKLDQETATMAATESPPRTPASSPRSGTRPSPSPSSQPRRSAPA